MNMSGTETYRRTDGQTDGHRTTAANTVACRIPTWWVGGQGVELAKERLAWGFDSRSADFTAAYATSFCLSVRLSVRHTRDD